MSKVVIVVSGGLVQNVYSESNDVEIKLIDCNVLKDELGKSHDEVNQIIKKEVDAMRDNQITVVE